VSSTVAEHETSREMEKSERDAKVLPIFQVVKFPNDVCKGSSRNGTCYTKEECSSKGGKNDGSCASGFGVCCVFSLSCGKSASENSTYIVQASATAVSSPCTYTICPCSTDICRIRYDLTTFVLASAQAGTTSSTSAVATHGDAIGDCLTDTFTINAPGNIGSPVICGTNSGYHMILDASSSCHTVNFNIGGSTTTSRKWDIRVTQYACGDYDLAGWPGCLQYYTATTSHIQNFAYPTSATTVTSSVTHLSNQKYDICIRRAKGYCYICYFPAITGTAVIAQISYGLGVATTAPAADSAVSTRCSSDYLNIPFGNTAAIAAITTPGTTATHVHRFCGRSLQLAAAAATITTVTVCSRRSPFVVGVNFDSNEANVGTTAIVATTNELNLFPGGINGFKLKYTQHTC
jgi:hypothetical protein